MNRTFLILDCPYLCHRARYVFESLSHNGSATGVVYGFLKDLETLKRQFNTNRLIFCWDVGESLRAKENTDYKANRKKSRKDITPEEYQNILDFRKQVKTLRKVYLKSIGYRNIFCQKDYEADDIIASICLNNLPQKDNAIIISADHDLYQLLSKRVCIYHPQMKKLITHQSFINQYGIKPYQWAEVKALAGCSTDNVKGVTGVGEKTAIKYLRGELKKDSAVYQRIVAAQKDGLMERNLSLVRLPYIGVNTFRLRKDRLSKPEWNKIMQGLGIKSIKRKWGD